MTPSNHALQRTRRERRGCHRGVPCAGSLSLGRSASRGETDKMALSARAKKLVAEITKGNLNLGDLKKRGTEIKKDHDLAMELWSTGEYYPRLLATLIFDKKLLAETVIDQLASDMLRHDAEERNQLADWLLANQLTKNKKLVSLIATWEKNPSPILRRLFWYHQARLRWVGQARVSNQVYQTWRNIGTLQGRACCQELYAVIPSGVYQNRSRQA